MKLRIPSAALSLLSTLNVQRFNPAPHTPHPPHGKYRIASASWQSDERPSIDGYLNSTAGMIDIISHAARDGAQIIIFPETSLNTPGTMQSTCPWEAAQETCAEYMPTISNSSDATFEIPCLDDSWNNRPLSKRLSCAARENNIYVLVTMYTTVLCSNATLGVLCPPGGVIVFNTIVVFDNEGKLVAKYYKRNLAEEAPMATQPNNRLLAEYPDNPILRTNFGVEFGLLICNDLFQPYPMDKYLAQGIQNYIWSNEALNFPTTGAQVGYAQGLSSSLKINVATSGAAYGANGVGLFSAGHVAAIHSSPAICTGTNLRTIDPRCLGYIVADLPKVPLHKGYVSMVDPPNNLEHAVDTFPCYSLPQVLFSELAPITGKLSSEEYDQFAQRSNMKGLCARVQLSAGSISKYLIHDEDRAMSCSMSGQLKSGANQTFILRIGELPSVHDTPCRGNIPMCSFLTEEALFSGSIVSASAELRILALHQVFNGDTNTKEHRPTAQLIGKDGIIRPFEKAKFGYAQSPSKKHTMLVASGNVSVAMIATIMAHAPKSWPECTECYNTALGYPEGQLTSEFPPAGENSSLVDQTLFETMCTDCDNPYGYQSMPQWPPAWAQRN